MYDVVGMGYAIIDTEANVHDDFVKAHEISKGHMTLVDSARVSELLTALGEVELHRCAGGSAANTVFTSQALGRSTFYCCKVAPDVAGEFFIEDMTRAGVTLNQNVRFHEGQSGQCLILITPDAQRTMNTDLGISETLGERELVTAAIPGARYIYTEGYLSSSPSARAAWGTFRAAAEDANVAVTMCLSDVSMVTFFREQLEGMLGNGVEILFCNEEEALSWAKTDRLDVAIAELKDIAAEVYLTLSERGSIAITKGVQSPVDGFKVQAVDTTGAGDVYAGACLAARCEGAEPKEAARFANFAASRIVAQYGARLDHPSEYAALKKRYR